MRKRSIEEQPIGGMPDYPDRPVRSSRQLEDPPAAREVPIRELDRRTCATIDVVTEEREVVVVSRYGLPVAMILPLDDAVRLLPPTYVLSGDLGELSKEFVRRARARQESRGAHGRWYPEVD